MATNGDALGLLRPAEFCALERRLVASMTMRKKRNVQMGPVQQLKIRLLEHVEGTRRLWREFLSRRPRPA